MVFRHTSSSVAERHSMVIRQKIRHSETCGFLPHIIRCVKTPQRGEQAVKQRSGLCSQQQKDYENWVEENAERSIDIREGILQV